MTFLVAGSAIAEDIHICRESPQELSLKGNANGWTSLRIENLNDAPASTPSVLAPDQIDFSDIDAII